MDCEELMKLAKVEMAYVKFDVPEIKNQQSICLTRISETILKCNVRSVKRRKTSSQSGEVHKQEEAQAPPSRQAHAPSAKDPWRHFCK